MAKLVILNGRDKMEVPSIISSHLHVHRTAGSPG